MSSDIRVRFAPSPTGLLHIGGLRTALYNYLFARHHGGTFVLRIEDTDRTRYIEEAEKDILESLHWADLIPDEGPLVAGEGEESPDTGATAEKRSRNEDKKTTTDRQKFTGKYGPYHQSARKERYMAYAQQLLDSGYAYYAFDTAGELEQMRERLRTPGNPTPKYDPVTRTEMRNSLTLPEEEVKRLLDEGAEMVIRLKIPFGETVRFDDLVRGPVSFETDGLDDQVLVKADGMPTYHLANVVDDYEMAISHVIRGEEWLSSAPKHVLLYRYLGWEPPAMAHLPLIMSPGGGKLSKRNAEEEGIPVNVRDYRSGHYERNAVINFLALLGWSPGEDREVLTPAEMISEFSLDRVGKSGAIFDFKKLMWFNEQYMRERSNEDLAEELTALAEEHGIPADVYHNKAYMAGVVGLLKERVSRLPDFLEAGQFFFEPPSEYDEKAAKKGWKEGALERVAKYRDRIDGLDETSFNAERLKQILTEVIEEEGVGFGKLMMPLRVAVTGTGSGPDLFATMELLGQKEVLWRLNVAIERLG